MNIFVTNVCPTQSAKEHCDVHTVKMILELSQMLSTAHFVLDGNRVGYKPTHINHPCSVFVRRTRGNYEWAYKHFKALCEEYTFRTGKIHLTQEKCLEALLEPPRAILDGGLTEFAMAMPDEYKARGIFDQTKAYKDYLNSKFKEWTSREKSVKVSWSCREIPSWVSLN